MAEKAVLGSLDEILPDKSTRPMRMVPDEAEMTSLVAKFISLEEEIHERIWEQAWIIATVDRVYGEGSIESFAHEVGISRSWAYKLLKLNSTFGSEPVAKHLPPTTHITIAQKVKDKSKAREVAEEAADAGWSRSRTESEIANKKEREDTQSRPSKRCCPLCEGDGEITDDAFVEYRAMVRRWRPRGAG